MKTSISLPGAVVALSVLLLAGSSHGSPPPTEGSETETRDVGPETADVPQIRRGMEQDMAELGRLANQAKKDTDMVRLACIRDKQDLAAGVMEVATGELLVIRDSSATPQARKFAVEKLAAAGERLHGLVEQAKACAGDQAPEDEDDKTRNELDVEEYVPWADPTRSLEQYPVPPSVDDTRPPVVASPTQ